MDNTYSYSIQGLCTSTDYQKLRYLFNIQFSSFETKNKIKGKITWTPYFF